MQVRPPPAARGDIIEFTADRSLTTHHRRAMADMRKGIGQWRLCWMLGWLDIRLRYRGSTLGPFWLTLSTAVMIAALGALYSTLFKTDLHTYLPFLAISLLLWGFISQVVADACAAYTQNEQMIRSLRMPYSLYAGRIVVRNLLILAHNIIVIVGVYWFVNSWPSPFALLEALPGILLWMIDGLAITLLLGAVCARFRDIQQIVGSVMQIAFYVSPIIWQPEQLGPGARWLPFNPFFTLMDIVRAPLLGHTPNALNWVSAVVSSLLLCSLSWLVFARSRNRLAFWV